MRLATGLAMMEVFIMTAAMMTTTVPTGTGDRGRAVDGVGGCVCDNHREVALVTADGGGVELWR